MILKENTKHSWKLLIYWTDDQPRLAYIIYLDRFPHIYSDSFSSSPATAHRAQQEKNCSETDSENNCEKVSGVFMIQFMCTPPVQLSPKVCIVCCLSWWSKVVSFPREMTNSRMGRVTADMPLCQRRRRTWRCSGGEGSAVALSSVIKLHSRWTVWK